MENGNEEAKVLYWQQIIKSDQLPELCKYIDEYYPLYWNKDLAKFIQEKFGVCVTTGQLRSYARKFSLVKNIDAKRKAMLLLKRYNPSVNDAIIEKALAFVQERGKYLTNREVLDLFLKDFGLVLTYEQLAGKINRWLEIKKSPEAIAKGRQITISGLKNKYWSKHKTFLDALSRYPQSLTVLFASLLGDADLCPVTRGYAVFRDHHGREQYEWLKFKAGFLPPEPFFNIRSFRDGSFALVSQSNPFFKELEEHFYREPSPAYKRLDARKQREKYPDAVTLQRCEEVFVKYPDLALAILIGDDGALVSSTKGNTVSFEYVIYCQGFAEEIGLQIKRIIEMAAGIEASVTKVASEYGIRLTVTKIEHIKKVSELIGPYLSKVKSDKFKKKYDLQWHVMRLSEKHKKRLSIVQPKNYWTEQELKIVADGINNNLKPVTIHKNLLKSGFNRTYFATYAKWKESQP